MPVINLNPWKYEYIRQLAEEATILARQEGLRPVLATEVVRTYKRNHRLNIPNLGDHVPEGWTRVDFLIEPVFVDIRAFPNLGSPMPSRPLNSSSVPSNTRRVSHLSWSAMV